MAIRCWQWSEGVGIGSGHFHVQCPQRDDLEDNQAPHWEGSMGRQWSELFSWQGTIHLKRTKVNEFKILRYRYRVSLWPQVLLVTDTTTTLPLYCSKIGNKTCQVMSAMWKHFQVNESDKKTRQDANSAQQKSLERICCFSESRRAHYSYTSRFGK